MHYARQQMLARAGHLAFIEEPAAPEGGDAAQEPQEGADTDGQQDDSADEPQEGEQSAFDSERALRKIQKLNSENKNLRTRAQEAEEKASSSDELTKANAAQASEILRLKVALKHGLPEALVGRLQGTTEEELLADAEDLMQLFVQRPPSQAPTVKTRRVATPESAEDGVDIEALALSQLKS